MKQTESIWAELIIRSQKLLVACVYRPPKQKSFLQHFEPILDRFFHRTNVILLGDFNIDLDDRNETAQKFDFVRILSRFNLKNLIKNHTRITDRSRTLIDLAITPNSAKVISSGSYDTAISDHNLIFLTFNIFVKKAQTKLKNYSRVQKC